MLELHLLYMGSFDSSLQQRAQKDSYTFFPHSCLTIHISMSEATVGYLRTGYPKKVRRPSKDSPRTERSTCQAAWREGLPGTGRQTDQPVEQPSEAELPSNLPTEKPSKVGMPSNQPAEQPSNTTINSQVNTLLKGRVNLVLSSYVGAMRHYQAMPKPWKRY
jgi:hypothetical protein